MNTDLRLVHVGVSLGSQALFGEVSVEVRPGEIATVMGPSGSGKSTLLSFVCGTLDPVFRARGQVIVAGDDVTQWPARRRRVGILFQDDMLFPHLSVGENLAFGLVETVRHRAERRGMVAAALAEAELTEFAERDPATLSGGQRARVALMRTLLAQPRALLLDEPFSKLDVELRERVRRFVFDHARRRSLPVLLVTHDPADAAAAGGPIIAIAPASLR